MEEKIERLVQLAYETGWFAGQAEAGKYVAEEFQRSRIRQRNESAAEIAAQIQAIELSWMDKVEELTDAWHPRLAAMEAQLAEMRLCLKWAEREVERGWIGEDTPVAEVGAWMERIRKALSAPPVEVLWTGEAVYISFGSIRTLAISNMEGIDLEDGQHGRVILIKEPDDEKPKP